MPAAPLTLKIEYLLLSELVDKFLQTNPKLHDIGAISTSIRRYGFRDPLAIDATLNGGEGGIAEGNGRLEALLWMYNEGEKPPAYISKFSALGQGLISKLAVVLTAVGGHFG